jgi:uncharacterized protein YukE
MSYEAGTGLYKAAAASATAAALLIRRPWAYYVVLMIGLMVSDPGQMSRSAKTWRTTDTGGTTDELTTLGNELAALRDSLGEHWEGEAFEHFKAAYEDFTTSIESLETTRNSTGEAVDQSAKLYYWGAVAFTVIAKCMLIYGLTLMFLRRNAYGNFIAYALDLKVSRTVVKEGKNVLLKHGIALGIITGLMYQAIKSSETNGAFPMMKAIPTELSALKSGGQPEFSGATVRYDVKSGQLLPPMDPSTLNGSLGQA